MSRLYPCVYCTEDGYCKKYSDEEVTSWCVQGPCKDEKPSNADRLRAMSDEELAELFANWIQDCGCNNVPCREPCAKKLDADIFAAAPCEKNWLDWLRQEASDG